MEGRHLAFHLFHSIFMELRCLDFSPRPAQHPLMLFCTQLVGMSLIPLLRVGAAASRVKQQATAWSSMRLHKNRSTKVTIYRTTSLERRSLHQHSQAKEECM